MLRRQCRRSLSAWCEHVLAARELRPAAHHRLLIDHLERVARGEIRRLMVFMPPGAAKSTFVSHLFPAWLFARLPGCQIIGASHTADLAEDFSGKIHGLIRASETVLGYGLRSEARGRWYTTNGGAYLATGVGGAIPGFRARIGIIDDPIKGRQAADSETDRKRIWDWYLGDFERRLIPGAAIVLMHTRWHMDDLAGRLLDAQKDKWTVLSLPAQAEQDDPLGRAPGEWLWNDDDYGYAATLATIKADLEAAAATREWASQYQQHPRPAEGALFRIGNIEILPAPPNERGALVGRGWDLAATREKDTRDPDWTVGVKLARLPDGRYVVIDVQRVRGGPDEVERTIVNTAAHDTRSVRVGLPQDPGQSGKSQVLYMTKALAGYTVESSPETGDKALRAGPVASQCNVGNLYIVEAPWNRAFLDELAAFPAGAHDDQVDALSRAFGIVGLKPAPLRVSEGAMRRAAMSPGIYVQRTMR